MYPLYIDPGTGSALFSIAIGIAAVAYFLVRGLYVKLKVLVFRKKADEGAEKGYVIFAEDKRYFGFFEPILRECEERQLEVLYLTTSADDPIFEAGYSYVKGRHIGEGNRAWGYLNFLSAKFVLTTTPELDVLQWKRSRGVDHYCHYIHAAGGPSLYRRFALDYFDSVLLPSGADIEEIRLIEEKRGLPAKDLAVVGNSYFDQAQERLKEFESASPEQFTVLVSPSWGPSALLSVYGEKLLDPLINTPWRIIIRPHPQSLLVEKALVDALKERYKDRPNIEWDTDRDNMKSLERAQVMISDFSGIIYEYVFLFDRPVIVNVQDLDLRRLDAHDLAEKPFYYRGFSQLGLELDPSGLDRIEETIRALVENQDYQAKRRELKEAMWPHRGESGRRVVDYMVGLDTSSA
ncbi:MAG: CDP-glycerol glycerophosphotransferase family protein [Treponema sp.]|nr:CDP-glycerol glycerophosphotransferase family protein [Treponema sp.]